MPYYRAFYDVSVESCEPDTQDLHPLVEDEHVVVSAGAESVGVEVRKHDRKVEKKCIKCRQWWPKDTHFGVHDTSSDGLQSICKVCKKNANKDAQNKNVPTRIRHHTATRCLEQLKGYVPHAFTRNLEDYLGYKIKALVNHLRADLRGREGPERDLRAALNEGYHIDHIRPLSLYKVVVPDEENPGQMKVDWEEFRRCWDIKNLSAIPGKENLKKSNKWEDIVGNSDDDAGNPF